MKLLLAHAGQLQTTLDACVSVNGRRLVLSTPVNMYESSPDADALE